ncbi:MAG: hypothetical protein ACI9EZ_002226 [Halobacteriales archaeon]|jgi:hypothetical protein
MGDREGTPNRPRQTANRIAITVHPEHVKHYDVGGNEWSTSVGTR